MPTPQGPRDRSGGDRGEILVGVEPAGDRLAAAEAAITSPSGAHLSRLAGTLLLAGNALALALAGTRLVVRRDNT